MVLMPYYTTLHTTDFRHDEASTLKYLITLWMPESFASVFLQHQLMRSAAGACLECKNKEKITGKWNTCRC